MTKEYQRQRAKNRNIARRAWISDVKSNYSCLVCNESAVECLDLHHINPETKTDTVSNLLSDNRPMRLVIEEVEKCVTLCANCHRKHHNNTLGYTFKEEECVKIPEHLKNVRI